MIAENKNSLHRLGREYWRITLTADPLDGLPKNVHIEGRRRNTEIFWPEFLLPAQEFHRLLTSVGNAAILTEGYRWTNTFSTPPIYPHAETLAICCGPFYTLELSESMCGNLVPTISMTIMACESPARPFLYLIDDEIAWFLADLQELDQTLSQFPGGQTQSEIDENYPLLLEFIDGNYGCVD